MALGQDGSQGERLGDLIGFCAWERGEVPLGTGGMMGRESEGPTVGHEMAWIRTQLGPQGVAGPA